MSLQALFGPQSGGVNKPVQPRAFSSANVQDADDGDAVGSGGGGLFGLWRDDDDVFDVRLGSQYASDKSLWIAVPLWLFLGGFGAHRFYLGHFKMGSAFGVVSMIIGMMLIFALIGEAGRVMHGGLLSKSGADFKSLGLASLVWYIGFAAWVLIDGIYMTCRMASSR